MTVLGAVVLSFIVSTLIIGVVSGYIHISTFKIYLDRRETRKRLHEQSIVLKKLEGFSYPKHLVTENDINLYLAKNSMHIFYEKDFPIFEMIKRMSKAGWNTEIPFYSKYKYGKYVFYLICDDKELVTKLYRIIHNYQENYDANKIYKDLNYSYQHLPKRQGLPAVLICGRVPQTVLWLIKSSFVLKFTHYAKLYTVISNF